MNFHESSLLGAILQRPPNIVGTGRLKTSNLLRACMYFSKQNHIFSVLLLAHFCIAFRLIFVSLGFSRRSWNVSSHREEQRFPVGRSLEGGPHLSRSWVVNGVKWIPYKWPYKWPLLHGELGVITKLTPTFVEFCYWARMKICGYLWPTL